MSSFETRRPFTRADALAAGISAKMLRGSRFRRIFRGVYVEARVPDHPLVRARAALLLHPADAFVSHVTAARVRGLPVPVHPDEHVTVSSAQDRRTRPGLRCHVGAAEAVTTVAGVRVSSAAGMFVELASLLSLVDLVVVGDALVRHGTVDLRTLRAHCDASRERHASAARRAAALVREEVDSPMETRLRLLIVLAGLPEPEVNVKVRNDAGVVVRRFDLSYPSVRLVVEYDGRQHVEVQASWRSDLDRREELDDGGWRLIVVTSDGIYRDPARTVARVHRALRACGHPAVPTRPADAWRPFFPGRAS